MIDPTKYMPLLQCYTCYNVTSRVSEGEGRVTRDNIRYARGDGAVFYRLMGLRLKLEQKKSPYFGKGDRKLIYIEGLWFRPPIRIFPTSHHVCFKIILACIRYSTIIAIITLWYIRRCWSPFNMYRIKYSTPLLVPILLHSAVSSCCLPY